MATLEPQTLNPYKSPNPKPPFKIPNPKPYTPEFERKDYKSPRLSSVQSHEALLSNPITQMTMKPSTQRP